jgi:hypothetical protein
MVAWRWYYHLPSVAFWALALVPLVLLRENRRLPAWAILVPLLAIVLGCRMLANLFSVPPGAAESFAVFCGTLATAWAIVWLLGPWLGDLPGAAAFLLAAMVMLLVGLLAYLACCGLTYNQGMPMLAMFYSLLAFGLVLSTTLGGRFCRPTFSPPRFMGMLLLWMWAVIAGGALLLDVMMIVIMIVAAGINPAALIMSSVGAFCGASFIAILLYLANLLFMALVFRTRFYRRRLCRVLRLADSASVSPGEGT